MVQSRPTNHEVPGSIPGSTVGIIPEGEDSRGDYGLGSLVEIRFKGPSWHYILLYHHLHHRDNITAPHGRPNLKSVTLLPCPGGRTTKSTRTCGGIGKKIFKMY